MKKTLLSCGALMAMACEQPPASPPETPSASAPTPTSPSTYPQAPTVSPEDLARVLPKDAEGRPILATVDGTNLTLGEKRVDAIGAAAACRDLGASCVMATGDLDRCVRTGRTCSTNTPWLESAACCPTACVDAYSEERRLGASPLEADAAVFGSTHECFPGLQEMIRAAGGTPRTMPRRAP
jgi:hypothetical protein